MDVGKDVRRRKGYSVLVDVALKEFINGYFRDNIDKMYETMELIREGSPVQWMRLNIELMKLGLAKEQNININFNRQQDREQLQALVRTRLPDVATTYTDFVEVKEEQRQLPK
jgi:hypothetical protein